MAAQFVALDSALVSPEEKGDSPSPPPPPPLVLTCILGTGAHIVALAAGHLDPDPAELVVAPRKQVVLAVTSNWHVFCLDHNLRLKWQASILVRGQSNEC